MSKTTTKTPNRRTEANRQNAAKSTGPRTAAGKGRSRLNALKHGLRAEQVVVLSGPNPEDPRDFDDLRDGLIDDRKPVGALEELLVERLAVGFWRLRRAYRFEAESIAQANKVDPLSKMLDELSKGPTPDRVQHVLPRLQNLDKLVRYESMIDRELLRSMALLQRMQLRRKLDQEPSDPFDATPASNPSAEARRSTDRRREEDQGSRKFGSRISDCELRNRERTSGLGRQASGRSVKPDARSPKPSSLHDSQTTNHEPRTSRKAQWPNEPKLADHQRHQPLAAECGAVGTARCASSTTSRVLQPARIYEWGERRALRSSAWAKSPRLGGDSGRRTATSRASRDVRRICTTVRQLWSPRVAGGS